MHNAKTTKPEIKHGIENGKTLKENYDIYTIYCYSFAKSVPEVRVSDK